MSGRLCRSLQMLLLNVNPSHPSPDAPLSIKHPPPKSKTMISNSWLELSRLAADWVKPGLSSCLGCLCYGRDVAIFLPHQPSRPVVLKQSNTQEGYLSFQARCGHTADTRGAGSLLASFTLIIVACV